MGSGVLERQRPGRSVESRQKVLLLYRQRSVIVVIVIVVIVIINVDDVASSFSRSDGDVVVVDAFENHLQLVVVVFVVVFVVFVGVD